MNKFPSPTFCLAPWTQLSVQPNGETYPCCAGDTNRPYFGNLNEDTIDQIWNNEKFKELRKQMIKGERPSFCDRCYKLEDVGEKSFRQTYSTEYNDYLKQLTPFNTDGSCSENNILYWDLRYTNKCNLICRTCSSQASSSWIPVEKEISRKPKLSKVANVFNENINLKSNFYEKLQNAKSIYFAGGEPLIMKEIPDILHHLIKIKKTDIELVYNSNMTNLDIMGEDIIELWNQFPNIKLRMSIDGIGDKGDYIRQGSKSELIIKNCHRVAKDAPHVTRILMPVFQIYNAFHLKDALTKLKELKVYREDCLHINILQTPNFLSLQALPLLWKKEIRNYWKGEEKLLGKQQTILDNFLFDQNNSKLLPSFFDHTDKLDLVFKTNFEKTFPEYNGLRTN